MEGNRRVSAAIPSKKAADCQTSSAWLLRQGRQRAQIGDQRIEVLRLELAGGVLHHFSHGLGEDVSIGGHAGSQDVLELGIAQLLESRRREVRRLDFLPEPRAGEKAVLLRCAKPVARRVAFSAMTERLNQIRAAIQDRIARGGRDEGAWRKEQQLPAPQRKAPADVELKVVRLAGTAAGRQAAQVRPQVLEIEIGDFGERGIRKRRVIMRTIRSHAEANRLDEILLAPATDAGPRMRRNVRAEESAERGVERTPAGVGLRVRPRLGVAADAAGGF